MNDILRRQQQAKQTFTGVGNSVPRLASMTEGVPLYAVVGGVLYEYLRVKNRIYKRAFEEIAKNSALGGDTVSYSSWTPVLSTGSASTVRGELMSIGNFRIAWFNIVFSTITSSAVMNITGIPDVPDDVFPAYGPVVFTRNWSGIPLSVLWSTTNAGIVFDDGDGVSSYLTGSQCSGMSFRAQLLYSVT